MVTTPGITGERARPARNARYLLAATVSLGIWYGLNFWPGWPTIPVLTPEAGSLLSPANVWLLAVGISSATFIVFDATWFKSAWQIFVTTTAIALAARAYVLFPFDFSGAYYYDFRWVARLVLALAVVGGLIRLIVVGVRFVQASMRAVDEYLWIRQIRSTMHTKSYMAALTRPMSSDAFASADSDYRAAPWGEPSDSIARTIAESPATSIRARFAELGGILGDEAIDDAPTAPTFTDAAGPEAVGETRRSRRAHVAPDQTRHVPRRGRRKAGAHAAR